MKKPDDESGFFVFITKSGLYALKLKLDDH